MEEKSFIRSTAGIALPAALQSMLQSSFSMIDQLMAGQLGSTAVAAIEAAGRTTFLCSFVTGAAAAIAGIMISQYLGMGDAEMADRSLSVNLTAAAGLAVLFTALCLLFPGPAVGIYTNDARVAAAGSSYIVWIAWTYLPMTVSSLLAVMIRCMDKAAYPLLAGFAGAAVNTGLNYLLIFGNGGFPALGIVGAAIASLVSQLVNFLLIGAMFFALKAKRRERFHFSLALGREGYKQYLFMLLPVLVNESLWSVGQNINTFIYGHLGGGDLAAMSMTGPVQGLLIGALSGMSQAAGILIGKRLGAREYEAAYRESKTLMWYGAAGSVILSLLLILLRDFYVRLYHVEDGVRATASALLLAFAVLAPVKVANMILGGGIIRSGGKTTYIMLIDMAGTWLVGVPLGLFTAFVLHLPIVWVYFILSQEELVRLLITLYVFKRGKWMTSLGAAS